MPVLSPTDLSATEPVRAPRSATGDLHANAQRASRAPAPRAAGSRVTISMAGREALARSEVAPRALDAIGKELSLPTERLDQAGREAFFESIRASDDLSTQATADRIHQGIITYLYEAFRLERPNPQREQIEQFVGAAARGLDRGLRDAAGLLLAFGARAEQLAAERAQTFERVREQVTEFAQARVAEVGRPSAAEAGAKLPELDLPGAPDDG